MYAMTTLYTCIPNSAARFHYTSNHLNLKAQHEIDENNVCAVLYCNAGIHAKLVITLLCASTEVSSAGDLQRHYHTWRKLTT